MVLDRSLNSESRTSGRYRLQQETVYVSAIDQVHQHFAVFTTPGDDRDKPRNCFAQTLSQYFDLGTDHCSIGNEHADLVTTNKSFGLCRRFRVMNVVQAASRVSYRRKKLLVLRQYENVNVVAAEVSHDGDLLRL